MIRFVSKKVLHLVTVSLAFFGVPLVSYAAPVCEGYTPGRLREFKDFICLVADLISVSIPVIVGLMLLVFFWGLAKFIFRVGGDEGAITEGRNIMIWGIIGLFVTVSIYGIIQFLYSDLFGGVLNIPPRLPMF